VRKPAVFNGVHLRGVGRWLVAATALVCVTALLIVGRSTLAASLHALRHLSWAWLVPAVIAEPLSLLLVARGHRYLLEAGGGRIRLRSVVAVAYAHTAIASTLPFGGMPAGATYSFRQYGHRGIELAVAGWAFAVSWLIGNLSFAMVLAVGAATAGNSLAAVAGLATSAVYLVPCVAILLALRYPAARRSIHRRTESLVGVSRRLTGRPRKDWTATLERQLDRMASLRLPGRRYGAVFGCTLGFWILDIGIFACAIRATGSPIPWHGLLLAYGAGEAAASFGITPGGIGVVEAALSAALVAAGLHAGNAVSAALVYRLVAFWSLVVTGWIVVAVLPGRKTGTSGGGTETAALLPGILPE
jgi:uncharacterized protein (TIRG00374 family)